MTSFGLLGMWSNPLTLTTALLLLATLFWTWMLLDAVRDPEPLDRLLWAVILVGAPFVGSLIYFFVRYLKRNPDLRGTLKRALLWLRTAGRPAATPEASTRAE